MASKIKQSKKFIVSELVEAFEDHIDEVKELIMDGYDTLSVRVTDTHSKTNPMLYRDAFEERLDTFVFIAREEDSINLSLPELDTFDFSGIPIIQTILTGPIGSFVEIDHDDLVKISGKTTVNRNPIDETVTKQKRVYLIRYTDQVRKKEKDVLKKKLVKFAFSNQPGLDKDVFGPAEEYVNANIEDWLDKSIKTSTKKIKQKF